MNEMKTPMNAMMKAQAMKMPIRSMKKTEDLVGGQKKLDKDKDGDLDAKDFAMLRKTKSEEVLDEKLSSQDLAKVKADGKTAVTIKGSEYVVFKVRGNDVEVTDADDRKTTHSMNDISRVYGLRDKPFEGVKEEKTKETDSEPKTKELNAMVKDPMNAMKDPMNAMKDMNATYMKSNVKAPVKDNGGADMAVVKDAPKMVAAMAKISNEKKMVNMKAMYGESREAAKRYLDTKPGSLEEAVLKSRGLIK